MKCSSITANGPEKYQSKIIWPVTSLSTLMPCSFFSIEFFIFYFLFSNYTSHSFHCPWIIAYWHIKLQIEINQLPSTWECLFIQSNMYDTILLAKVKFDSYKSHPIECQIKFYKNHRNFCIWHEWYVEIFYANDSGISIKITCKNFIKYGFLTKEIITEIIPADDTEKCQHANYYRIIIH